MAGYLIVLQGPSKETVHALVKGLRRSIDNKNVDPENDEDVNKFMEQFLGAMGVIKRPDSTVGYKDIARTAVAAAMMLVPLEGGDYGLPDSE